MDVAFISEATYPHFFGGVSVWCDQLVRGMTGYDFHVVNLVATGTEPMVWELPENVASVATIPLWGAPPAGPRPPGKRARRAFGQMLAEFLGVVLSDQHAGQDPALSLAFGDSLREMFEYAQVE